MISFQSSPSANPVLGSQDFGEWHFVHLSLLQEIPPFVRRIAEEMASLGYPDRDIFGVRLALEECLVNSIRHGHLCDPEKVVLIRFSVTDERVLLSIEDEGPGFDPSSIPDPTASENLGNPNGRGLFLMKKFMTWVHFNEPGNCVTLCKCRSEKPARAEVSA